MSTLTPLENKTAEETHDSGKYRDAQEIPLQLIEHIHAYYEEDLNAQAFDFLHSIVSNSVSAYNRSAKVSLPPPPHIALAATLAVHPNTTSRTDDRSRQAQSVSALKLLRLISAVAGPNAPFQKAFHFRKYQANFFHVAVKDEIDGSTYLDTRHQYSGVNSLFDRADDFWSLVGWAFNCACLPDMYAERWNAYEPFLELFIQILESDYVYHHKQATWEESLFWSYVETASGGYGSSRRIFRAIFASGNTRDLNEFREIFNKELKKPVKKNDDEYIKPDPNRKVDLDNDEFADYMSSMSEYSETEDTRPTKRPRRTARRTASARSSNESLNSTYSTDANSSSTTTTTLGSPSALSMRIRLLRLLAALSTQPSLIAHSSSAFVAEEELYTLFVEFIKPLPLDIFKQVILPDSPVSSAFDVNTHLTMCEAILQRTLESSAPRNVASPMSAEKMVSCYLPFAASGGDVDAQARVALVVEAMVRILLKEGMIGEEGGVDVGIVGWAVEEGCRRREVIASESTRRSGGGVGSDGTAGKKGKGRGKKKTAAQIAGEEEEYKRTVLRESGERLRVLIPGVQ